MKPYHIGWIIFLVFFLSLLLTIGEGLAVLFYPVFKLGASTSQLIAGQLWDYSGMLCHQIPERSLFVTGHQLPLCNRCVFAVTAKISFALLLLNKNFRDLILKNFALITVFILPPLMLEAVLKVFFGYASGLAVRSINGVLQGIFLYLFLFALSHYFLKYREWAAIFAGLRNARKAFLHKTAA